MAARQSVLDAFTPPVWAPTFCYECEEVMPVRADGACSGCGQRWNLARPLRLITKIGDHVMYGDPRYMYFGPAPKIRSIGRLRTIALVAWAILWVVLAVVLIKFRAY